MDTWMILVIAVLLIILCILSIIKYVMFPKELMKCIDSPTKYVDKLKNGEIVQMKFQQFVKEYNKNKSKFLINKQYARVLNKEVKKNGKGTQLVPRVIHFTILDKVRYLRWVKHVLSEGKIKSRK